MYNGGKIILGIVIFLALATYPFFGDIGKATVTPEPNLDTPEIRKLEEKKCVESAEFMKAEHMSLLNKWRDMSVRDETTVYVASDGDRHTVSLQNTCMRCHSNKKEFCDKCHEYTGVKPYCWDCHLAPKEGK
ncbi:MAG: sulfate reduction electron transfer complex DsrMKJOP subunit DsrJ [Actinobacteria bacterium]|nr:sulfate reduction electron transfer complex DsrMKJOP subunit DsrJ [Actinomycetota bacterium]